MIDARETAPAGIALSMYLDSAGKPIPRATLQGGKAAAIPGAPAGIVHLARKYGKLPLAQTLAPAIALARDGFKVDPRYARVAKQRERFLAEGVNTARAFLDGNQAPKPAICCVSRSSPQRSRLHRTRAAAFYRGPIGITRRGG
jgi:gamma-glutamyltranspeptidase/glutathione hydrolase